MKKSHFQRIFASAMALLMLGLAGCGGGAQPSTPSSTTSGKTIRMTATFASAFDPAGAADSASCTAVVNMYDSLVYPGLDGSILNGVAESYKVSDDGLTYTFHLKQGVLFHDGSTMTASDVAFSYQRLMALGQGYAYLFESYVDAVTATDDSTVTITLKQPFAPFLNILCRLYIVNEDVVMANLGTGDHGDLGDYGMAYLSEHDAGSGAYTCTSYTMGDRIVMSRFANYHGTFAENAPETVELINGTETATVRTMMANGELEISDQWQTAEAYQALGQIEGVNLGTYGSGQILYLMLNTKKTPTDDVHVRKALSYLIDYAQVSNSLFPGYLPVKNYVGDSLIGSDISAEKYAYNLDKAKEEISASSYADQLLNGSLPIEIAWISDVPDEEKLALLVQASAAQIGVTVKVTKVAWSTHVQNVAAVDSTANMGVCFVSPDYSEAGSMLYQRLHSDTVGTWQQMEWLQNPELDSKIQTALTTMDNTTRFGLYAQIQQEALDQVYGIPVTEQGEQRAYADYIYFPAMAQGTACTTLGYNFLFKDFQVNDH